MRDKRLVLILVLAAVAVALLLAPLASFAPDGLERVALDHGFAAQADEPPMTAPIPDYRLPGLGDSPLATSLAGFAGVALILAITYLLQVTLARGRKAGGHHGPRS